MSVSPLPPTTHTQSLILEATMLETSTRKDGFRLRVKKKKKKAFLSNENFYVQSVSFVRLNLKLFIRCILFQAFRRRTEQLLCIY